MCYGNSTLTTRTELTGGIDSRYSGRRDRGLQFSSKRGFAKSRASPVCAADAGEAYSERA